MKSFPLFLLPVCGIEDAVIVLYFYDAPVISNPVV